MSLSAATIATGLGLPCGVAPAVWRFPGRHAVNLVANSLLGLPPVVVGLALYLLLSHTGHRTVGMAEAAVHTNGDGHRASSAGAADCDSARASQRRRHMGRIRRRAI